MIFTKLILSVLLVFTGAAQAKELSITVDNIWVQKKGVLYVSIYNDAESFEARSNPLQTSSIEVAQDIETVVFDIGDHSGEIAVSIFHDFNGNQDMDNNIIGLPKEGFGVSNNPRSLTGPPKFSDAVISAEATDSLTVRVNYMFR